MKASYIQFEAPKNGKNSSKDGLIKNIFLKGYLRRNGN